MLSGMLKACGRCSTSSVVLLDAGPLGMVTHPRPTAAALAWLRTLRANALTIAVPEIADYEVRRELVLQGKTRGLNRLDQFNSAVLYAPPTTATMRDAADLWAQMRRQGTPTAAPAALDGDVILAAQARALMAVGHPVIVVTTNVAYLARLVPTKLWSDIL